MVLQRKLWRMNRVFAKYNLAACIKGALEMQGYDVGPPLPPQTPLSAAGRAEIKGILADLREKFSEHGANRPLKRRRAHSRRAGNA